MQTRIAKTLITAAIAVVVILGCAQSAAAQKLDVQLGFHADGAWSNVMGPGTDTTQARTTVAVGGIVVLQLPHSMFGLETGISYVHKGAYDTVRGTTALLQLTYAEVPALLRVAVPLPGSAIRSVLSVGPVVGIRTHCHLLAHNDYASASIDCADYAFNGRFDFRSVDLGAMAGLDIDIPIGSRLVVFPRVTYQRSVMSIENKTPAALPVIYGMDWLANSDTRNTVYEIGVGARWRVQ